MPTIVPGYRVIFKDTPGNILLDGQYRSLLAAVKQLEMKRKFSGYTFSRIFSIRILPLRPSKDREINPQFFKGIPRIENLDAKILAALNHGGTLDMEQWHRGFSLDEPCQTTHCLAGWAVHLAGKEGRALERRFYTEVAAALIYWMNTRKVPNFFVSQKSALAGLRKRANANLFPQGIANSL